MRRSITGMRNENGCILFLNGVKVKHIIKHSPTGMAWGYGGSGPSDTARSILSLVLPEPIVGRCYQKFKWDFVAKWQGDTVREEIDIEEWLKKVEKESLCQT